MRNIEQRNAAIVCRSEASVYESHRTTAAMVSAAIDEVLFMRIKVRHCCHGQSHPAAFYAGEGDNILIRDAQQLREARISSVVSNSKVSVVFLDQPEQSEREIDADRVFAVLLD